MSLHEFMLRHVCPSNHLSTDTYFATRRLPSKLTLLLDGQNRTLRTHDETLSLNDRSAFNKIATKYKPQRIKQLLRDFKDATAGSLVADMDDCRRFSSEVFFGGRSLNVLQYNRHVSDITAVLWPLHDYFRPDKRALGHARGDLFHDSVPFDQKEDKVIWRGSLSGSHWVSPFSRRSIAKCDAFKPFPTPFSRVNALRSSNDNRRLDIRFVSNSENETGFEGYDAPKADMYEMTESKYVLSLPGNDVGSDLYWKISSNSLVLKEDCDFEVIPDYFLKPWVHYVPVAKDLRDIDEKLEYLDANQSLCKQIVDNAKRAYEVMLDAELWEGAQSTVLDRLGVQV